MLPDLLDLLKSYGPGIAPWSLLFAFIAFSATKGGKMAISNVQTLLHEQEQLRQRTKKELDSCLDIIRRRDATIDLLEQELEQERAAKTLLRRERDALEDQIRDLNRENEAMQRRLDPLRGERR